MRIDTALIRKLAELLTSNSLTEIEVEDGGRRIKVRRDALVAATGAAPAAPATAPIAAASTTVPADQGEAGPPANAVKSPMVGTVFLSPEPGAQPFVVPGQTVSEGETLLIIEAMKVMNAITAPRAGTVRQILVADSQPVEYDQPLVIVE